MSQLRVSVATYDQVVFPHLENGMTMLALERKATVLKNGSLNVRAQPFGGGVKILNIKPLQAMIGEIRFDSDRSKQEQDFRILIEPSQWEVVKQYCLLHLEHPNDPDLESAPDRELVEEFAETLQVDLKLNQYMVQPLGFVVEDEPVLTENWYARGFLTVRVYRTYQVEIVDRNLCQQLLDVSQQVSVQELGRQALTNEKGRANSVLVLPLNSIREAYLALPPEMRYRKIEINGCHIDESALVILNDVEVPEYIRR